MNNSILIGPINMGHSPRGGDTMKNQLFLKRFKDIFDTVVPVDTYNWRKRPWRLLKLFFLLICHPQWKIIISANSRSAYVIIKILNFLGKASRTYYWVIGGSLKKLLESHQLNISTYKGLAGIFVEGKSMVKSLNENGLMNVSCVPNLKFIHTLPEKHPNCGAIFHFVFLSRIEREKGCDYIIRAAKLLDDLGYKKKYDITFYGKTTIDLSYEEEFMKQIDGNDSLIYKGVINLLDYHNYQELSEYDVMLFPTYWEGEGFPGVIIDAFIAGLPVIASDWNLNREVVSEGETGWIIPVHDVEALALKMEYVINNPEIVKTYSKNCQRQALAYDIRNVLSKDNMRKLGLIE